MSESLCKMAQLVDFGNSKTHPSRNMEAQASNQKADSNRHKVLPWDWLRSSLL